MDILKQLPFTLLLGFPFNVLVFALLQLMPSRRWLFSFAGATLCLIILNYIYYMSSPARANDHLGDIFIVPGFYMIGFAIIIGTITRYFVLKLKSKSVSTNKIFLATILGLFLFIAIPCAYLFISQKLSKWGNRPPSTDCDYYKVPIEMDKTRLIIPGLEFIHIAIGDGNEKSEIKKIQKYNIYFHGNKALRGYCEEYSN